MAMREYRKGNWTVEETIILIEAKRKDDERRRLNRSKQTLQSSTSTTASPTSSSTSTSKPVTELRWKWVEEYCWGKGCFRSQNQCNDKWDNLMRDYKKVRDYQKSLSNKIYHQTTATTTTTPNKSYWDMDKIERKDKGLPTNMLPQIYQALFDVVETTTTTTPTTSFSPLVLVPSLQLSPAAPPPMLPPPRLPSPSPSPFSPAFLSPQPLPSPSLLEAETSEQHSQDPEKSPAKRSRKEEGGGGSGVAATRTAAVVTATERATGAAVAAAASTGSLEEVSTAICRSANILSEAIRASEERQERRHREMINLHESSLEMNRQGFNGLTDAINRLASSIFEWANSQKPQHQGP